MKLFAVIVFAMSVAAGAAAQAPKSYDDMKKMVAIDASNPSGLRIASSARFAVVKRNARATNGGQGSISASVIAEARPGSPTRVAILTSRVFSIFPTEVPAWEKEVDTELDRKGFTGAPWRETAYRILQSEVECQGASQWCRWTGYYRFELTAEDVRAMLADPKQKLIMLGRETKNSEWTIPKEHLAATLDALGVLGEFS